jgi:hypothetical protein
LEISLEKETYVVQEMESLIREAKESDEEELEISCVK